MSKMSSRSWRQIYFCCLFAQFLNVFPNELVLFCKFIASVWTTQVSLRHSASTVPLPDDRYAVAHKCLVHSLSLSLPGVQPTLCPKLHLLHTAEPSSTHLAFLFLCTIGFVLCTYLLYEHLDIIITGTVN